MSSQKDKGPVILTEPIALGVSACVYGANTRYNRNGWDMIAYFGRDVADFVWHPVCPECLAGLGVPRDPIKVVGESGQDVWDGKSRIKSKRGKDVTEDIIKGVNCALEMLERGNVKAFVFMEGSPTCGVYRTTLKDRRLGKPPGVFGAKLFERGYFLIPALDLQSPIKRWDWRRRLVAFTWLNELSITKKSELIDMWHVLKFLCQEINRKEADLIGKSLANMPKSLDEQYISSIKLSISNILRVPSTVAKIKNMLWKNYIYYKKATGESVETINQPTTLRSMTSVAEELIELERKSFSKGIMFGSTPVIIRKAR